MPDIIGYAKDGKFAAIEIKAEGDYASQEQKDVVQKLLKAGVRAGFARSVDDAIEIMEESLPAE
jgi:hypothetical protein